MLKHLPFVLLAACGTLQDYGGDVPPLATIHVQTGDERQAPHGVDRVALVWGMQWLPEAFCILPPENADAATVQQRGCRDSFGFVPLRVEADAAIDPVTKQATIELFDVPGADVRGRRRHRARRVRRPRPLQRPRRQQHADDHQARAHPEQQHGAAGHGSGADHAGADDVVSATFIDMLLQDSRLAYREGAFVPSAFYPRQRLAATRRPGSRS